jgi:hypothetical protein
MTQPRSSAGLASLTALYGDPMVTDALITSRARNTPEPGTLADAWHPPRSGPFAGGALPNGDDPKLLAWWQPEVRAYVCAQELLRGLHFEWNDHDASATLSRDLVVEVDITALGADTSTAFDSVAVGGMVPVRVQSPIVTVARPGREVFDAQLDMVIAHAESDLRRSRAQEALAQVLPQVLFWSAVVPLSPWRTPHTYEFIGIALNFGNQLCHRFKHALAVPRPSELSPLVQPILQTPGWAAFPSGHATEAFMFARLIMGLLGQGTSADSELWSTLRWQAASIASNRVYAGLHFPIDSVSGRLLGHALAEYVMAVCGQDSGPGPGQWVARSFVVNEKSQALDLDVSASIDDGGASGCYRANGPSRAATASPILVEMWRRARVELQGLGF